jgi:hypothetical protein
METPNSEQIIRTFGRNVEILALQRGISLKSMADSLQTSSGAFSRARKQATRYMDPQILLGCARLLECTTDELLNPIDGVKY